MDPQLLDQIPKTYDSGSVHQLYAALEETVRQSYQTFLDFNVGETIFWVKIISVILTGGLLIIFLSIIAKIKQKLSQPTLSIEQAVTLTEKRQVYDGEWQQIISYANSTSPSEWKLAIIEGDKILDDALRLAGVAGESMGERLMALNDDRFPSLQAVWDAHKMRNFLVHDINYSISQRDALNAAYAFEKGLRDLGMLS